MSNANLKSTWDNYYDAAVGDTVLKDRNFFRLELEAIVSAVKSAVTSLPSDGLIRIVELGSGAGTLAGVVLDVLPPDVRKRACYIGVDFSESATARAMSHQFENATFVCSDFLEFLEKAEPVHLLIAQRSVMAVIEESDQKRLLGLISDKLAPNGTVILSEGIAQAQERIDLLRERIGIDRMRPIWHCRYLDLHVVKAIFPEAEISDFASQYWLITRVFYPFAVEPAHNTPLHDLAAELPQTGDLGLVKLIVSKKPAK